MLIVLLIECLFYVRFFFLELKQNRGKIKLSNIEEVSSGSTAYMWKPTAPALLKLFISGYERCHTTDAR